MDTLEYPGTYISFLWIRNQAAMSTPAQEADEFCNNLLSVRSF